MQPVLRTANDTAALRAVAPPVSEAGPAYVTAAGTGNATVHGRHLAEGLYRRDGTYYSLALAETHRPEPAWGLWYPVLALAGVVVGLDLLRVAARAAGLQVRVGAD